MRWANLLPSLENNTVRRRRQRGFIACRSHRSLICENLNTRLSGVTCRRDDSFFGRMRTCTFALVRLVQTPSHESANQGGEIVLEVHHIVVVVLRAAGATPE